MADGWGTWTQSWAWSLALLAITIATHAAGIVGIATATRRLRAGLLSRGSAFPDNAVGVILLIVGVALSLAALHAIECLTWAVVYVRLGAVPSPADAVLYSVDSMTTRGSSGLFLAWHWRMMGATEAGDGMLLFGLSTAFLFYVLLHLWRAESNVA